MVIGWPSNSAAHFHSTRPSLPSLRPPTPRSSAKARTPGLHSDRTCSPPPPRAGHSPDHAAVFGSNHVPPALIFVAVGRSRRKMHFVHSQFLISPSTRIASAAQSCAAAPSSRPRRRRAGSAELATSPLPHRRRCRAGEALASPTPCTARDFPPPRGPQHRRPPPATVRARWHLQELRPSVMHPSDPVAGAINLRPAPLPPFPTGRAHAAV
jgi:hypothetical protein